MAATIVRPGSTEAQSERHDRLAELVRDLTGVDRASAAAALLDAPPPPAEPLERVAHALVQLRRRRRVRIAGYVPQRLPRPAQVADIAGLPQLPAGPAWPGQDRAPSRRPRNRLRTTSSTQPSGSAIERSTP